jgi:predicted alpha/beta-fold hydrolase
MQPGITSQLLERPFVPHPALRNTHAQTIAAALIPRRPRLLPQRTSLRHFDVAEGVRVVAHCSWQDAPRSHPTVLVVHGLEGSAESAYMLGTAEKSLASGFNVLRLNLRNCGGTEHMTTTLYHAGLTDDVRQIIRELTGADGLREIYLVGFSLGGNIVLKLAGEMGSDPPESVRGVVAISPSIDLLSCIEAIELRSNLFYHLRFVMSLKTRMQRKARLFPDRYDSSLLRGVWSIRQFDNAYTAPHSGFADATDYYKRASALPLIAQIAMPTLIIHAKDDPFIPFAPFEGSEISSNPNVVMITPDNGGHVGFVSAHLEYDDRFWAEARAVQFIAWLNEC